METKSDQTTDANSKVVIDFSSQSQGLQSNLSNENLDSDDKNPNWISLLLKQKKEQDALKTTSVQWADVAHTAFVFCSVYFLL